MASKIPTTPADFDSTRIVERPDGYWWQPLDGGRERGPFTTLVEAVAEMEINDEAFIEDDTEGVRWVGEALGVPDWVDPETGQLADDLWTRIEDH